MVHSDAEVLVWFCDHVMTEMDVWVACRGSAIIAMMVIDGDWIEQLYVNPSQTDRGLGSALVEHAKALGTNRLELWTFVSNVRAQRFYERHGFVEIDRTNGDNEERQPDIRYRWSAS